MDEYEYYYEGAEFYCYPNTKILINKFGIRDEQKLNDIERELAYLKAVKFEEEPPYPIFDFEYYCNIHKFLFEEIYEWAGKIREGEFMFKGDSMFYRGQYIESGFTDFYNRLKKEDFLKNLKKQEFCERMAYYMGFLDAIHPFREGNGRTMRLYFNQLAQNAGYKLTFSKVTKEQLHVADVEAFNTNYAPLIDVLNIITTPI